MIELNKQLEDIKEDNTKIGAEAPKIRTMSDVVKTGNYRLDEFYKEKEELRLRKEKTAPMYTSDINVKLRSGLSRGIQDIKEIKEGVQIFEGQTLMSLGNFVGSKDNVEIGRIMIQSAYDELQAKEREYYNQAIPMSPEDYESYTFGLGQGITNYGVMLATGYLGKAATGIGTMALMEGSQKSVEKAQYYTEKTKDTDFKEYTPQQATKDAALTAIYTAGSAILEKKLGYGEQRKIFKIPTGEKLKAIVKTAVSEGGTEFTQELYGVGIDLVGGYIDFSKLPEKFMGAVKEGVIGGILGGTAGIAAAVNHRSQAKAILRDELKNTVPEKDLDLVVDAVYENTQASLKEIIAQELVQSESLRNKHGEIYNSIKTEIYKQIKSIGAYEGETEDRVAQYVESLSKDFADKVIAEANKRKVTIDDVFKSSNIRYENGELYLGNRVDDLISKVKSKNIRIRPDENRMNLLSFLRHKGGLKDVGGELKSRDAQKQYIGLINNKKGMNFDDAALLAWEHGYFPSKTERPTINELLEAIDRSLRGEKIYSYEDQPISEKIQEKTNKTINEEEYDRLLSSFFSEEDIKDLPYNEKERLYEEISSQANAVSDEDYIQSEIDSLSEDEQERYAIMTENGATHEQAMEHIKGKKTEFIPDEDIFEFYQLSEEMAQLDEVHPEYTGETININGVDKTVYNSNGDRIAKSEQALQNFYNWFGDSKVVDEQGRPLVVYHGSDADFNEFDVKKIGKNGTADGSGFNFTTNKDFAEGFTFLQNGVKSVYLRINNPINSRENVSITRKQLDKIVNRIENELLAYKESKKEFHRIIDESFGNFTERTNFSFFENLLSTVVSYGNENNEDANPYNDFWRIVNDETGIDGYVRDYSKDNKVFVVFNPNQIKSVSNKGTYSTESDNIYYQANIVDSLKNLFTPLSKDIKTFIDDINKVMKGEDTRIRVGNIPFIYKKLGMKEGLVRTNKDVIVKDTIGKHNVPLEIVDKLPELYADPLIVMSSRTEKGRLVSVLDVKDDLGNQIIVAISPNKKEVGGYHFIPSFYGKEEFENFMELNIKENRIKYIKDNSVSDTLQLRSQALSDVVLDSNILQKSDIVNTASYQGKQDKIKGAFDRLTKSIKITNKADFSTYQHEFAHFWLDNIWEYMQSGLASEEYTKQWTGVMKYLGMTDRDKYPTRQQHEKFARAYEKYLVNGNVPNSMIGEAFDKYENFIRQVYDSMQDVDERAGKKYKPLTMEMYDFFDSMVTGKLPIPQGLQESITREESVKEVKKEIEQAKDVVSEATKVVDERKENYTLKPLQTDTKTGYSSVMKKTTGEDVEMGSTTLQDQMEKANKFVSENTEEAEKIVKGEKREPEGISKNAIYIAYQNLMERLGNVDARAESLINQAMELRRMGQEIATQRLAYDNLDSLSTPQYWINKILSDKAQSLAQANNITVEKLNQKIEDIIEKNDDKSEKEILDIAKNELGVLYQIDPEQIGAYKSIKNYVDAGLGLTLTDEQVKEIITRADNMKKNLQNSKSENGNPSVYWFEQLKSMEDYANEIQPSSELRVLVSVIGRGNLLASIKSPLTNVISNTPVGLYRAALRRITLKTTENKINPDKIKALKDYSWDIFVKTGYNVNNMTKETPMNQYLGEKITHSQGKGFIRALGRIYEEYIYKWSLGAGDIYFKDKAFIDYLALKCSKENSVEKANKLFDDAILIEPTTEEGKKLRQEAIDESLIATFQNKGKVSETALGLRNRLDFGVGLGEFIAPFVKTPANVVGMGLEVGFGGIKAIASEVIRDMKAGKILKPTKENINSVCANGLGLLLASLLLSFIDDEDYMPGYALASSKEKQLVKELNIPYNSIRWGDTWFSLDYLGPLATPLIGLLQARRADNITDAVFGYTQSGGLQILSIPALGNIGDITKTVENMLRPSSGDFVGGIVDSTLESIYARTVPAIVSDVAKAIDDYDRLRKGNEYKVKIPVVREDVEKKINLTTGRAEKIDNALIDLLAGSRVKVQIKNKVANELKRLSDKGWGVSLTDVTQRGLLSEAKDNFKKEIRQDFARQYSDEVNKLISSSKYIKSSDEDKKEMIEKIRRKIVESMKKKYLKKR